MEQYLGVSKMAKLYLFTSTTCPKCPTAKNLITTHNLNCEIIEVGTTPGGENKALTAGVSHVPQFVEKDGAEHTLIMLDNDELFNNMIKKYKINQ